MSDKLLTEHHLEFLSLKGGCRGSSESTHVKMLICWKSHVAAHYYYIIIVSLQQIGFYGGEHGSFACVAKRKNGQADCRMVSHVISSYHLV